MLRPSTRADFAARLDHVVRHIADHLDDPIDLDSLAAVAHASRFHFQRMYRLFLGETPDQTVRRLRLHRAAAELGQGDSPLAGIAARAGYSSAEAFSRAFSQAYGSPPAAFRAQRRSCDMPSTPALPADPGAQPMDDVVIAPFPAVRLAGLPHRGSYQAIGATFERVYAAAAGANLLARGARTIGVYWDDPDSQPEETLRSFAGVSIAAEGAVPAGLEVMTIDAGVGASLVFQGPYADLHRAYRHLFMEWLPGSGREPADAPAFEEYLNDPRRLPPARWRTRITLPLRA